MALFRSWLRSLSHTPGKTDLPTHTWGTHKGEELVSKRGREPGREEGGLARTARDSTSVNPEGREPIDSRMPHIPPA
jgi:hypothetical protein